MVGIECFYFAFRGRQILNHKCFIVIGTTCMTMDIIDKCFYMSHERQMKLIFQIDIDYPQGYYQVIMAQLEMWPVALQFSQIFFSKDIKQEDQKGLHVGDIPMRISYNASVFECYNIHVLHSFSRSLFTCSECIPIE